MATNQPPERGLSSFDKHRPDEDATHLIPEELRRERELAASAGTISKRTMATAFGALFIFVAIVTALWSNQSAAAWSLGGVGALLIVWAIGSWLQRRSGGSRPESGSHLSDGARP